MSTFSYTISFAEEEIPMLKEAFENIIQACKSEIKTGNTNHQIGRKRTAEKILNKLNETGSVQTSGHNYFDTRDL